MFATAILTPLCASWLSLLNCTDGGFETWRQPSALGKHRKQKKEVCRANKKSGRLYNRENVFHIYIFLWIHVRSVTVITSRVLRHRATCQHQNNTNTPIALNEKHVPVCQKRKAFFSKNSRTDVNQCLHSFLHFDRAKFRICEDVSFTCSCAPLEGTTSKIHYRQYHFSSCSPITPTVAIENRAGGVIDMLFLLLLFLLLHRY